MSRRVILTVSGFVAADIREQIASGHRPRADYLELARSFDADLLDYAAARTIAGRTGRVLEKIGGLNLVLAYACWKIRKSYQAIVTDGEQIGLPLAALLKFTPGARPRHMMIVHVISEPKRNGLPGLAWRAKRHRPLHYIQPLATALHRGTLEIESQPGAVDTLHG